jgi:UDP-2-acetamido-3-amino-2,3-dideoxy-glucuronate N-acetyltransferase
MILSLAGEEPESVLTTGGNYLHQKIADVTTTHLEFPSGMRAHIFVSWLHPFKDQKLVVVGDKKMAVFDDTQPWPEKLLLYPHEINWNNGVPVPAKAKPEQVNSIPESEPLKMECGHFLNCMRKGNRPLTDGREGLMVLKVLNMSQSSLDNHGQKIMSSKFAGEGPDNFFAHPSAVIDANVRIGKGTKIWHFTHIISNSSISDYCNIGQNVVIGPDVNIGKGCKIQNNVSIYKGITLEEDVFCGPSMVFTNVFNPRANIKKMDQARPTLVKKGATIGANATII